MKILFCSDMHLGLVVGGYDMRDDTLRVLREIVVAGQYADLIVVGGDLFHTPRPSPQSYADMIQFLFELETPTIIIRGNHDESDGKKSDALEPLRKIGRSGNDRLFEWSSVITGGQDIFGDEDWRVFIADTPGIVGFDNETEEKKFLLAGHIANARAVAMGAENAQQMVDEAFKLALSEKVDAGFCHLDVDGAEAGSEGAFLRGGELQIPMKLARRIAAPVVNGHVHKKQTMGNVFMPGSVIGTDFSDVDGDKGYAVLEV